MKRNNLFALLLLFLAAPLRAVQLDLRGEPAVAVAAPLTASVVPGAASSSVGLSASPLAGMSVVELSQALGPVAADREIRANLTEAVIQQAAKLESLQEHMTYATQSGARVVLVPFDGKMFPHLVGDSLAQAEAEDKMVFMNWSLAGHDRYSLERSGLSPQQAERVTALSLAPVLGHEVKHLKLRDEAGINFPGLREEEILTHLDQAEAVDEIARRERGLADIRNLLSQQFVFIHNEKLMERWRRGFGEVAEYVMRKYDQTPALNEREKNLAVAQALNARWQKNPEGVPPVWRERIANAARFWGDEGAVRRVTELLQAKIDEAYKRYGRIRGSVPH